jgi:hypothetical protein
MQGVDAVAQSGHLLQWGEAGGVDEKNRRREECEEQTPAFSENTRKMAGE